MTSPEAEIARLQQRIAELEQELNTLRVDPSLQFLERSLDMFCIANFDGYFIKLNPIWSQVLGYSEEELLARPFLSFVHPDDQAMTIEIAQKLSLHNEDITSFENRYLCKDGTYRWLHWSASADPARQIIYASAYDITAAHEAETKLHEQARMMELILDSMSDGVIALDARGNTAITNPAATRMFGRIAAGTPETDWPAVYGNFLPDTSTPFPVDDLPMSRALRGQESHNVLMFVRRAELPEGMWVVVNGRPLHDDDGSLIGGMVLCRDITQERLAQEQLRLSEARFRDIATSIPGAVFQRTINPDGSIVDFISERIREIAGVSASDVMSDPDALPNCVHPEDRQAFDQALSEAITSQKPWHFEGRYLWESGAVRWWQGDARAKRLKDGTITFTGVIIDITDRKQAEEAMRQSMIKEEIIQAQQAAIEELSTPLIPITDTVVVMPLIGAVDSRRAQQVMETLLTGIGETNAEVAILDITGVSVVDTRVADALLRAAQAVRLLGAEVMLTGIRPEVAQTLVGLGVDLTGISTQGSLQSGIAIAMRRRKR